MRLYLRGLAIVMTAVALTTACSDNKGDDVASISGSSGPSGSRAATGPDGEDAYSRCMREHGVAPAPVEGGDNSGTVTNTAPPADEQRKQQQAQEECRQYLPNGGNAQPLDPAQLEQARAIARCMRAAGVQYPDPDPGAGVLGGGNGGGAMPVPSGVDLNDPTVRAKLDACEQQVGAGAGGASPGGAGR